MTDASTGFLAAATVCAALDWLAVTRHNERLEYVFKPAAMVALVAVAVTLEPDVEGARGAVVAALLFSLAGDVFLMLRRSDYFVHGLAAFLAAHLAYIVAFQIEGGAVWLVLLLFAVIRAGTLVITVRLLRALRASGRTNLAAPVRAYAIAICGMVAAAAATGDPLALAGALLFLFSDLLIAWSRFVGPLPWAPLAIMVTYHLGQAGLVLSLA